MFWLGVNFLPFVTNLSKNGSHLYKCSRILQLFTRCFFYSGINLRRTHFPNLDTTQIQKMTVLGWMGGLEYCGHFINSFTWIFLHSYSRRMSLSGSQNAFVVSYQWGWSFYTVNHNMTLEDIKDPVPICFVCYGCRTSLMELIHHSMPYVFLRYCHVQTRHCRPVWRRFCRPFSIHSKIYNEWALLNLF